MYFSTSIDRPNGYLFGTESVKKTLSYGILQGSVFGPPLYTIYTAPVGELLHQQ